MTKQPTISIIIPVYNAETSLKRCIDSVLSQTFPDFELILIDDGSIDNSGKICDNYAIADKRISVIHKQNEGVSAARQCGIDMARGIFTIHVDSDDWIESSMLKELYNNAVENNSDMVICDYYEDRENSSKYITQRPSNCNPYQVIYDLFQRLHGSCCNKLIKSDCYKKHKIRFVNGINILEDKIFVIETCYFMKRISYLNQAFYHYDRTNDMSITQQANKRINVNSLMSAFNELQTFYTNNKIEDNLLVSGLKLFRISTLSGVALYGGEYNRQIKYGNYLNLIPLIHKQKVLSLPHKIALYLRILGLGCLIPVMLLVRKSILRKSK